MPLGRRDVYGYVVGRPAELPTDGERLREIAARVDGDPAFTAEGLHLARWMADRYCCSLDEALGAVVFAGAIPRAVDRFVPRAAAPAPGRLSSVEDRLVRLIWEDFPGGFALEALVRHPEARRAGDRRSLLRQIGALVRAGSLERTRSFGAARMKHAQERVLEATGVDVRGPRVRALAALVAGSGQLRRADAVLAGFSNAVIARAVREGALVETQRRPAPPEGSLGGGSALVPTPEQQGAIDAVASAIDRGAFAEFLLQGVTGSGKTLVYIEAIVRVLARGERAIVLVPEIALTPQTARRFEAAFGERVAVLHSALSERERFDSWHAAARGEVDVVVGARSALFAPLPGVRLVVVDEAHERTYKQDSTPRYNAVAVARERMRAADGVLVLGSATPPLEAYAAAVAGSTQRLVLPARATAAPMPAARSSTWRSSSSAGIGGSSAARSSTRSACGWSAARKSCCS